MTALTGMSTYAAAFLIPVSVCIYTAAGGLKGECLLMTGFLKVKLKFKKEAVISQRGTLYKQILDWRVHHYIDMSLRLLKIECH